MKQNIIRQSISQEESTTEEEIARRSASLPSFPDSFIMPENDKIAYKQFGNAVNVEVVYRVMSKTLELY